MKKVFYMISCQIFECFYEGFEQFLAEKYITKEELLDVLSGLVSKSELLKKSVIALDGFTGFTPVQSRLLGELMNICKEMYITVVMDGREDAFRYTHPYQLFALGKQMVTSLVQIARRQACGDCRAGQAA